MNQARWAYILLAAGAFITALASGLEAQTGAGRLARFEGTAATAKAEANAAVAIDLLRWSTEEERAALMAALRQREGGAGGAEAAGAGGGRGGRGGGGGGGGRGGAGRGGAGGGEEAGGGLTGFLGDAETLGYVWTAESVGYSIRYAHQIPLADGGERIILALDQPFGSRNPTLWESPPADDSYTVLELRLDPQGQGEGRSVLATAMAYAFGMDGYEAAEILLENLRRDN